MAFTSPPTFTNGAVLTASQMNILSDDITYLYGLVVTAVPWHGAEAYRNTNLSIPNTTRTLVTLPFGENFDTDGFHDLVTDSSRLTLPTGLVTAGLLAAVIMQGYVEWEANSTGYRELRVIKNGVRNSETSVPAVTGTMGQQIALTTAGSGDDYFEIDAYQNSGGSLNITAAAFGLFVVGIQ